MGLLDKMKEGFKSKKAEAKVEAHDRIEKNAENIGKSIGGFVGDPTGHLARGTGKVAAGTGKMIKKGWKSYSGSIQENKKQNNKKKHKPKKKNKMEFMLVPVKEKNHAKPKKEEEFDIKDFNPSDPSTYPKRF